MTSVFNKDKVFSAVLPNTLPLIPERPIIPMTTTPALHSAATLVITFPGTPALI